ncbi:Rho termination factor [Belliella marina]|uniref:Rho termination factor n=1 Tax=Belliella marina TaxID=1644146 RepID=A0ABW4VTV4_9BACT
MVKRTDNRIKNKDQYEALRDKGYSKSKSARIANTPVDEMDEGMGVKYESRTKNELYQKAKQVGIKGRSKMNKKKLINALRYN